MKDILFISPSNEKLGLFHSFVPRSVPLAIGLLSSYLVKHGYNIDIIDEETHTLDEKLLQAKMEKMSTPRVFGLSIMTTNAAKSYKIAKMIKSLDKEAIILAGGIHPTVAADEVLQTKLIDYVVRGEGERALLEILLNIKNGTLNKIKDIKAVSYINENGETIHNLKDIEPFDVNELPMFPYNLFNDKHYDMGFILTSRGCPFDCIFCSQRAITRGKYRPRENQEVLKELKYLIEVKGMKNITFFDDLFTGHKKRVFILCDMIIEHGLHNKCSFGVQSRADCINEELLIKMKSAGFNSIMFGFESASNRLLKLINKRESAEDNINAIKLAKKIGFNTEATFIFGFPTETYEDRLLSLQIAIATGVDRARFNIATPYPGTALYRRAKEEGKLKIEEGWKNFNSVGVITNSLFKKYTVPYCPDGVRPVDLAGEVVLANLLFYLNMKNMSKLFNTKKSGSGKWFEISGKKAFNPFIWIKLLMLTCSIGFKALYFLIVSNECKKFFFQGFFKQKKA